METLKGVFPALLTPFTKDDRIHEKVLADLVEYNLEKGVNGFYVGGSTAEAFLLSLEERKQILEVVMATVAGRASVITHIGCIATSQSIELAKHACRLGVQALSSIPPFYYKFSIEEIRNYYMQIVNEVDVPMIIYNFPGNSGVVFTDDDLAYFLNDCRFAGIKHTSNDYFALERIKTRFPEKVVFNGFDEMFLAGISMGADGGIGSTYNFMAEKFISICDLVRIGRADEALAVQHDINTIIKEIIKVGVIPGVKAVMNLLGFDFGVARAPFRELGEQEIHTLSEIALPLLQR